MASEKITSEQRKIKYRPFTPKIPMNTVLVGRNFLTGAYKIYTRPWPFLHMPGFESRFISLDEFNLECKDLKIQFDGTSSGANDQSCCEVLIDLAAQVNFNFDEKKFERKMNIFSRWGSAIKSLKTFRGFFKALLLAGGIAGTSFLLGPTAALWLAAFAGGYISLFHQDQEFVKKQGPCIYFRNCTEKNPAEEIAQVLEQEVRLVVANMDAKEARTVQINLSDPKWSSLKAKLASIYTKNGITCSDVYVTRDDFTEQTDEFFRKLEQHEITKRDGEAKNVIAKQRDKDRIEIDEEKFALIADRVKKLEAAGWTHDEAMDFVKSAMWAEADGQKFIGVDPVVGVNPTAPKQKRYKRKTN